ncbi:MAG TPA: hypothetical protein VNK91_07490 [Burkholderiaceae bacterium]|nr:hypothetical protein [Burkholderiaceae bacterium]
MSKMRSIAASGAGGVIPGRAERARDLGISAVAPFEIAVNGGGCVVPNPRPAPTAHFENHP